MAFLVGMAPAGAPTRAATAHPLKQSPKPVQLVVAAPVPQVMATPAPQVIAQATASPTPRPTMAGTMPPATVPPTPSPPPPTTPTPVPATHFARIITVGYAKMRTSPSLSASVVQKVPHGQIAGLLYPSTSGTWWRATYRGKTGYIPTNRLQTVNLVGQSLAVQYARLIVVARIQQHVEVWQNGKLMLISAVTTGRPDLVTPLGTTKVLKKESPHLFQSPWQWPSIYWYPPGWADYAVLFRNGGFYFHDTHYRQENGYGIGTNVPHIDPDGVERTGSRGCVNTPYWAVRSIYGWAQLGDQVVVVDA